MKEDEQRPNVNLGVHVQEYDEGDSHLARGSQDPGAVPEPSTVVEDASAVILDQGDHNLLQGCQDPGSEETTRNRRVG